MALPLRREMDVVDLQIYLMTARNFFAQREATDDVVLYVDCRGQNTCILYTVFQKNVNSRLCIMKLEGTIRFL